MPKAKIKVYCNQWPQCSCESCPGCRKAKKEVTSKTSDHCKNHDNLCHVGCETT